MSHHLQVIVEDRVDALVVERRSCHLIWAWLWRPFVLARGVRKWLSCSGNLAPSEDGVVGIASAQTWMTTQLENSWTQAFVAAASFKTLDMRHCRAYWRIMATTQQNFSDESSPFWGLVANLEFGRHHCLECPKTSLEPRAMELLFLFRS